ncbi:DUF3006 domain-containing protein [Tepidibacter hydrothermalis]|uniref:DUF3006 domain-containing protein n=1 Tax=Tepidibacter hydrothermalis TaxID=3036126 RepID=A0ABY8E751_9FIRM|nr:DUF3006 domain-containing protein [Tepidibacter hydrothermalis]WFD08721.1 DUF3006 domain-containing protein [Tepidibacter hydrothermalis]
MFNLKFVIDRFEGDYTVVELDNKTIAEIPKILIPKDAKEGDVLEIRVDVEETEKRKNEINNLMDDLFED